MPHPILQFGTGRFLQAHVDLFVSEALAAGNALGRIAVVQTTDSAESTRRLAALADGSGYRVEIRGLRAGRPVEEVVHVGSVGAAWNAARDWHLLLEAIASEVRVIVSNTADRGFELSEADGPEALTRYTTPPASFPAKLVVLLHHRWSVHPAAPLTIYPCELVPRNGDTLREIVVALASTWRLPDAFLGYLRRQCTWANSLVDRIVSSALHPIGAIAEPYALWAIEQCAQLVLPCEHAAIVVTSELAKFERLKLMLLNLGHSFLAERWLVDKRCATETVLDAMRDRAVSASLDAVWNDEVLPLFDAIGEGTEARAYLAEVRDRFCNPFLEHRIADIAHNHAEKKRRRFGPVIELAASQTPPIRQPRLRAALGT
ncbi:MAG TPA: mannitol dehydrogenase family protein [Burkholderiaceae bacterium]|nr:mannitol dehydrogenase family protein [Burkholderiaceae bacterium]